MSQLVWGLCTLVMACAVGLVLSRLHMPGGMMVGAMVGACVLNLCTGEAYMPDIVKTLSQILAGALIGAGISRDEARGMRQVLKPALILLPSLLVINILCGLLLQKTGEMDLITALMATTPGGISNIPMIAADLGADPAKVVVLQFMRLLLGVGVFPLIIRKVDPGSAVTQQKPKVARKKAKVKLLPVALTLAVAAAMGIFGNFSPIPSGTMAFSTLGTIGFKMLYPSAHIPRCMGKLAQCLSGAFVGAGIGWMELRELSHMPGPVALMVLCFSLGALGISQVLWRTGCFCKKEAMLAATPAGASDMALICADMGIQNVNLVILQLLRMVTVITVFPSILLAIAHLFQ